MSQTDRMTDTAAVLAHHITSFGEGDLSELMSDYADESVLVSNLGTFHGRKEIENAYGGFIEEFSQPGVDLTIDEQIVEGETAYTVWHAETPANSYEFATDTYVIRDGIIETQTFAAKITPKN